MDKTLEQRNGYNAGKISAVRHTGSYWLTSIQSSLLRQGKSQEYVDAFIKGFIAGKKEKEGTTNGTD